MKTYFDSINDYIAPFLDEFWGRCQNKVALFVRGSAIAHGSKYAIKPLDIDILLFVHGDTESSSLISSEISKACRKAYPEIPSLDIKVVDCSIVNPEYMMSILLVSTTGKLLFGRNLALPICHFKEMQNELVRFSIDAAQSKLESVIKNTNPLIQKKRIPHLSKMILRIGGLMKIKEGFYTRSPSECALIMCELLPNLKESVSVILNSFNIETSEVVLFNSYIEVLRIIKCEIYYG
ncbi:MAG TPA: hypothetical protein EYM57_07690 [Gammaproteobacteria bacterium]|jgi:hypothetical protein|nr:hypothetical protein [Gammaproteobacteria bacterium]